MELHKTSFRNHVVMPLDAEPWINGFHWSLKLCNNVLHWKNVLRGLECVPTFYRYRFCSYCNQQLIKLLKREVVRKEIILSTAMLWNSGDGFVFAMQRSDPVPALWKVIVSLGKCHSHVCAELLMMIRSQISLSNQLNLAKYKQKLTYIFSVY